MCPLQVWDKESNNLWSARYYGDDSRFGLKSPQPDPVWLYKTLLQPSSEWRHSSKLNFYDLKMQFFSILDLIAVFVAIKVSEVVLGFFVFWLITALICSCSVFPGRMGKCLVSTCPGRVWTQYGHNLLDDVSARPRLQQERWCLILGKWSISPIDRKTRAIIFENLL